MTLREAHDFAHGFSRGRDPFFIEGIDLPIDNVTAVFRTANGWALGYRERGQFSLRAEFGTEAETAEGFLDALARLGHIPTGWRETRELEAE